MARNDRLNSELYYLRERKRDLKQRIGQSMSDTGSFGTTGKCKKLQRQLSQVVRVEKIKKKKLRKW